MNIKSDVAPFSMPPEADLPPHILEGFNRLGSSQFLRELHQFSNIRCAASFAIKHHNESMRAGWRETELYGLHPAAPGPRVQYRGFAFLVKPGDTVTQIAPEFISFKNERGISQRYFRWLDSGDAVLAWSLCEPNAGRRSCAG
jgi:hypothetical protein